MNVPGKVAVAIIPIAEFTIRNKGNGAIQTQPWRLRNHHSRVKSAVKMSRNGQLSQTLYSDGLTYSV